MAAAQKLFEAIRSADAAGAKSALDDGAPPDSRDEFNQTALCASILFGRLEIATLLIDRGADPNLRGSMASPLAAASSQGHASIVSALLAKGAEVDENAQILAKVNGHADVLEILARATEVAEEKARAYAEAEPPALVVAASAGDLEGLKAALAAGGAVEERDRDGRTALEAAVEAGSLDALTFLLSNGAKPSVDALMAAAGGGSKEMVAALIDAGLPVDTKHPARGWTALMVSSSQGAIEMLRFLLGRGASARATSTSGWTALMLAAKEGHEEAVSALLEAGAEIDAKTQTGSTALMSAAGGGHAEVVKRLLAKDAATDPVESEIGANALIAAAISGNGSIVSMLLERGMDPNVTTQDGFGALVYCAMAGDLDAVDLLLKTGAEVDHANDAGETPLLRAAAEGQAGSVAKLLAAGAEIDHASAEGLTALMLAADRGHLEVATLLLEKGADREPRSLGLRTAYDYARLAAHDDIEELLAPPAREIPKLKLPAGQSPEESRKLMDAIWGNDFDAAVTAIEAGASVRGGGEDIPLIAAAHAGATDIVRLLLENGAEVDAADSTGLTALAKACGGCQVAMARALLEKGAKVTSDVLMAASIRRHPGIAALLHLEEE